MTQHILVQKHQLQKIILIISNFIFIKINVQYAINQIRELKLLNKRQLTKALKKLQLCPYCNQKAKMVNWNDKLVICGNCNKLVGVEHLEN